MATNTLASRHRAAAGVSQGTGDIAPLSVGAAGRDASDGQPAVAERSLVAIDRDGNVIPALRRHVAQAAAYGALGLLGTIGFYTLAAGDPLVMALSLVGTAAWGHGILVTHWLERASALMLRGELDTAEALLRRCLRPPWGSEAVRAQAYLRLSTLYSRRGEHRQAQEAAELAIRLFSAEYPPQPQFVQLSRYQEIRALVGAGKQADARLHFAEIETLPIGDYLRGQHYLTELYIALVDNRLPILDAALWERCELALRTPSAEPLIALCAWGFFCLGEASTARDLLGTARSRISEPLAQTMPQLQRWMDSVGA
jgi:tetratricopeptide (TPR) repeat protein